MQGLVARTKRLRIFLREDGLIVGASADDAWASEIFGVEPSKLVRQSIAQYLDVFHDFSKGGCGRLTPDAGTGDAPLASTVMSVNILPKANRPGLLLLVMLAAVLHSL